MVAQLGATATQSWGIYMGRFGELLRRVAPLFEVAGAGMVVSQVVNVLLDDEEAAQHGATSCPIYLEGIPRDG